MAINANDILRVVCRFQLPAMQFAVNVFWLRAQESGDESEGYEDIRNWCEDVYGEIHPELSGQMKYDRIGITNVTQGLTEDVGSWPTFAVGGRSAEALPPGVAGVITGYTRRERTRARKFIPGLCEDRFNGIVFASAVVTALAEFGLRWMDSFDGLLSGITFLPGVPVQGGQFLPIESVRVSAEPGYQRRRRLGRGQ